MAPKSDKKQNVWEETHI